MTRILCSFCFLLLNGALTFAEGPTVFTAPRSTLYWTVVVYAIRLDSESISPISEDELKTGVESSLSVLRVFHSDPLSDLIEKALATDFQSDETATRDCRELVQIYFDGKLRLEFAVGRYGARVYLTGREVRDSQVLSQIAREVLPRFLEGAPPE
jgi:hypothetical protein